MRSIRFVAPAVGVLALAVAGYAYFGHRSHRSTESTVTALMHLALPDAHGKTRSPGAWRGHVLVINFWATWCAPCRKETPILVRAQREYASKGVQIVGIAVDTADNVLQFASKYHVSYPLLVGNVNVLDLTRGLGNNASALPYTIVLNRGGRVVLTRLGGISGPEIDGAIRAALQ